MELAILPQEVMGIVGSHQPQIVFFCQRDDARHGLLLLRQAVILNLDEIIFLAKDIQIFLQGLFCPEHIPPDNPGRHLSGNTGTKADEPLAVFPQQLLVHSGLVVHALSIGTRHQLHQILIAFVVFCQKNQMIVSGAIHLVLLMAVPGSHINLAANNRVNALSLADLVELHDAKHIAMIRYSNMLHAQLLHPGHKRLDSIGTI